MGNVTSVIEGLQIFQRYVPGLWVEAAHDEIFGPSPEELDLSTEDLKRLEELDWFVDGEVDCWARFV